jgi:signal transduction histidine kinase
LIAAAAAGGAALVWWAPARGGTDDEPDRGLLRRSAGIALLGLAAVVFIARQVGLSSLTAAIGAVAVILGGAALVASPFIVRLVRDRDRERAERLAVRQRAEIAAHLHDSVLQTLSLIQREHTDPDTVLRLARAEERGLRTWLYAQQPAPGQPAGLADQLQNAAAGVEQAQAALIEVVTVGDLTTHTPATDAVVAAAREAMLNAARHSGDPQPIQVFARISPAEVSVFIRDRGCGFDPDTLPTDRGGVRDSIIGRIAHAGGTTTIRSNPGAGSEVQIRMPL